MPCGTAPSCGHSSERKDPLVKRHPAWWVGAAENPIGVVLEQMQGKSVWHHRTRRNFFALRGGTCSEYKEIQQRFEARLQIIYLQRGLWEIWSAQGVVQPHVRWSGLTLWTQLLILHLQRLELHSVPHKLCDLEQTAGLWGLQFSHPCNEWGYNPCTGHLKGLLQQSKGKKGTTSSEAVKCCTNMMDDY